MSTVDFLEVIAGCKTKEVPGVRLRKRDNRAAMQEWLAFIIG